MITETARVVAMLYNGGEDFAAVAHRMGHPHRAWTHRILRQAGYHIERVALMPDEEILIRRGRAQRVVQRMRWAGPWPQTRTSNNEQKDASIMGRASRAHQCGGTWARTNIMDSPISRRNDCFLRKKLESPKRILARTELEL